MGEFRPCRVPGCPRHAEFAKVLLCRRHYDRARYRVMQGIAWDVVLGPSGLALLIDRFSRSGLRTAPRKVRPSAPTTPRPLLVQVWIPGEQPSTRSCVVCENLMPVAPRFLCCNKNAWPPGIVKLGLRSVEECGLPPALHQFARNCPYFAAFSRPPRHQERK